MLENVRPLGGVYCSPFSFLFPISGRIFLERDSQWRAVYIYFAFCGLKIAFAIISGVLKIVLFFEGNLKEEMTAIYLFKKFDFGKGIPLGKSNFLKW
eukprot:UN20777